MPLTPGTTLGPYSVTAQIGAGGMGEVYRARDTKLDRDVALKILPEDFASDPERLARFQREAKVLAALNHPNIAQIHGLEESGDTPALVLEYVDGPTLQDRIGQGAIPLDEALPIAKQIAEALEAAHEQGIIHRDLKPANIKVTPDGVVKALDFGLAKALEPEQSHEDVANSPTMSMTAAATRAGFILGTAAYMSPEQAKGKPVDKRTDIWAYGVVLFEMLTGRQAFGGTDISETLASVLKTDVTLDELPAEVPHGLRRVLSRCLQKDRSQRSRDIGDVRLGIDDALVAPGESPVNTGAQSSAGVWQRPVPILVPVLLAGAVAVVAAWGITRAPEPASHPVRRLAITPPPSAGLSLSAGNVLAISPDARTLVFRATGAGASQLYRRRLDQFGVTPIRDTEGGANPFFSPDGEWLGFFANEVIRKISLAGGDALTVSEYSSQRRATWGPGDTIVFGTNDGGLMRVSAGGGVPELLTTPEADNESHQHPSFLPGGGAVLFTAWSGAADTARIAVYSFDSGEQRVLFAGTVPKFTQGHIVFGRRDTLWAAPFDVDELAVTGEPFLVLEGAAGTPGIGHPYFQTARDGTLAYVPGGGVTGSRPLVWVDRDGQEEPVDTSPLRYAGARISPDGTRIALDARDDEDDIWIWNIERRTLTRLTTSPEPDRTPTWTPDSMTVAFGSRRDGLGDIYWMAADGTGGVERLTDAPSVQVPLGFTADGSRLVFTESLGSQSDIGVLGLDNERQSETLLSTEFDEGNADVSPDGRWVAYQSDASGLEAIYVRPFPNVDDGRVQVSTAGARHPMWGPDGRELFFMAPGRQGGEFDLIAIPVEAAPSFNVGTPEVVLSGPYLANVGWRPFDISPDGQRFLMIRERAVGDTVPTQINVVEHWFEELKARVPTSQ